MVRSISMVVKGYYRTLGGASTSTARSATFNTTDRCDGTLTQVGKGRVTVAAKKKTVVVRRPGVPGEGQVVQGAQGRRLRVR